MPSHYPEQEALMNNVLAQAEIVGPIVNSAERLGVLETILIIAIIAMLYSVWSQGRKSKAEQDNRRDELRMQSELLQQHAKMVDTNSREADLRGQSIALGNKLAEQLGMQTELLRKLIQEERDDRKDLRELVVSGFMRADDTQTARNSELLKALNEIQNQLAAVENAVKESDHTSKTNAKQRTQFEARALQLLEGIQKSIAHIESQTAASTRTTITIPNSSPDSQLLKDKTNP
jgi:ABC-type lipoprotein release transport system permease subunit